MTLIVKNSKTIASLVLYTAMIYVLADQNIISMTFVVYDAISRRIHVKNKRLVTHCIPARLSDLRRNSVPYRMTKQ